MTSGCVGVGGRWEGGERGVAGLQNGWVLIKGACQAGKVPRRMPADRWRLGADCGALLAPGPAHAAHLGQLAVVAQQLLPFDLPHTQ